MTPRPRSVFHPRILFLHGGPGLNSVAEAELLGPRLRDSGIEPHFWNEPSEARPGSWPFRTERAFSNQVESARAILDHLRSESDSPIDLVAHSFGCNVAWDLLAESLGIRRLFLVAPAFSIHSVYRRVM